MASPGGGDQDTPPPATGTTESTTDYDKAPPIEEWQNDADKKDYMKAQPNIEEGGWAVPPPPDAWDNDQDYQHGLDEDEIKADPKLNVSITVPTSGSPVPPAESPTKTLLHRTVHKYVKKPDANTNSALLELQLDRMRLVYNALVNQTNNNAPFIGTNDKLTRLKLFGGLESICRLKLSWAQFDSMWTKLDSIRTGDLDLTEFKNFFGDLSEFEAKEGLKSLTLHNADASMQSLAVCLADMCDVMRHAGFTVEEMFCCFDRNGNGTITPSEFCSLLRLIIGPTFDKKIVYEALMTLDTDRDKAISRYELFMFVYRTWKMQLEEIDYRKSMMDPEVEPGDARRFNELNKERNQIREALRRNFNRELRDLLEAQGATQLAGPFATLLAPNSPTNPATAQNMADSAWFQAPGLSGVQKGSSVHKMSMSADFTSTMPLPSTQEGRNSTPGSPARSQSPHRSRRSNTHGQIMRFKIKAPGASSPHRPGKTLTLPKVNAVKPPEASNQAAAEILKASAPVDNLN
jgi:Ca2+-binding EF-hand superfamily protein